MYIYKGLQPYLGALSINIFLFCRVFKESGESTQSIRQVVHFNPCRWQTKEKEKEPKKVNAVPRENGQWGGVGGRRVFLVVENGSTV